MIAPDLGTISRAVRECAPLVKADASDQTSIIIELALHYIRAHQIERHAVQEFRAAHGVREASPEPPTSSDLKVPSRHKDAA